MSKLIWPRKDNDAQKNERVVVVPKTPDFDRPFAQRVPKPPRINSAPQVPISETEPIKRSSPIQFGLVLAIATVVAICTIAYYVMIDRHEPTEREKMALSATLRNVPLAVQEQTPADIVKQLDVKSVRLAAENTRASINGKVYRVGEVIDEEIGLVFAGQDPDGEYLLFRDADKRVHLYNLYQN